MKQTPVRKLRGEALKAYRDDLARRKAVWEDQKPIRNAEKKREESALKNLFNDIMKGKFKEN